MQDGIVVVTFVGADGERRSIEAERGSSLLDAAHAAGVKIEATCGMRGRCRSCRVKVLKGDVPPPTLQDRLQLGEEDVRERFRLACQVRLIADCEVKPMSLRSEAGHKILASGAPANSDDRLTIDSGVEKHVIRANTPQEENHQTSDVEEILLALPIQLKSKVPIDVVRQLPAALRANEGLLTVTVFDGEVLDIEPGDTSEHLYGIAFDIGTTSVVGTLMDLRTGEQLAEVGNINAQSTYGGDLMSRIAFAQFDEKKLQTLRATVLNQINGFIQGLCTEAKVSANHVYKVMIVGNTCMHHVFLGIDVSYVGMAPYAPTWRDPVVLPARDIPLKSAPNAKVCMLPIVAGFVGADTVACVLATRIYEGDAIRVLVDIGTNGETVMGSSKGLVACSAPAGPAFEGAQIRNGMRGAVGAIEKVRIDGDIHCETVGNAPPVGICGSGLIDACAELCEARVIDSTGRIRRERREALPSGLRDRFVDSANGGEYVLVRADHSGRDGAIVLTQADVRQLQLAKSSIYSGVAMLQHVMSVPNETLTELLLCGGFGNYINIGNAIKIRLLPDLPMDRIKYVGNAALLGAQMALLSETERHRAEELARRIEHVSLATHPAFQDIFVDGMNFSGDSFAEEMERASNLTGAEI